MGDRWLTGEADLLPELAYDDDYNKAGLQKARKFVALGNDIGMEFESAINLIGCVCTDAAGNYSGKQTGFKGFLVRAREQTELAFFLV